MTPRAKWSYQAGRRGYRVTVATRAASRFLYIRWWNARTGKPVWRCLHHADRDRAKREAEQLSADLHAAATLGGPPRAAGAATVAQVFAWYEREVLPLLGVVLQRETRRRLDLWRTYLGPETELARVEPVVFKRFVKERREGRIVVGKRKLKKAPTLRTVGADLAVLRTICNHALGARVGGVPLLSRNPVAGLDIPTTPAPRRPVATYERYLAVRKAAPKVSPLFGPFLDLLEGLGWRVSALCRLRAADFDFTTSTASPFGRIQKRAEHDKEGIAMWVPISGQVAEAGKQLLALTKAAGEAFLFTTSRRPTQAWSRWYARDLLERTEAKAGLPPLEGGDFHPYRRAWATARKHLPVADVAAAGGWKSAMTVLRHYQQSDEATLYQVVADPHKLRAPAQKRSRRIAEDS